MKAPFGFRSGGTSASQRPVAGWGKPGNGFRLPMKVWRPTLVEGLWVGYEIKFVPRQEAFLLRRWWIFRW